MKRSPLAGAAGTLRARGLRGNSGYSSRTYGRRRPNADCSPSTPISPAALTVWWRLPRSLHPSTGFLRPSSLYCGPSDFNSYGSRT
jgi:hypothetical protein